MLIAIKTLAAALLISFTSWLAGSRPTLAGFLMALPVSSMIAIAFTQAEFQDANKSVAFAKSIFASVPLSLVFFLPFLFADKLKLPFWLQYIAGVALLFLAYLAHSRFFANEP